MHMDHLLASTSVKERHNVEDGEGNAENTEV